MECIAVLSQFYLSFQSSIHFWNAKTTSVFPATEVIGSHVSGKCVQEKTNGKFHLVNDIYRLESQNTRLEKP